MIAKYIWYLGQVKPHLADIVQHALERGHQVALVLSLHCGDPCKQRVLTIALYALLSRFSLIGKMCLLVHGGRKCQPESRELSLPITTDTCARLREILKAGVKEFGEVSVFGRNVWTEGRLRSYVWLKFPARYPDSSRSLLSFIADIGTTFYLVYYIQPASCSARSCCLRTDLGGPSPTSTVSWTGLKYPARW